MRRTYNYSCINWNCSSDHFLKVSKDESLIDREELCPECGKPMKLMGEDYNCFATFTSKSNEQKKEIIKKRADEHNKTKMRDRVPEIRKRITGG